MTSRALPLQVGDGVEQIRDGVSEARMANRLELHRRDVYQRRDVFYALCSCGWMGLPELTWVSAASVACPCEIALAEGQERRRRILGAAV